MVDNRDFFYLNRYELEIYEELYAKFIVNLEHKNFNRMYEILQSMKQKFDEKKILDLIAIYNDALNNNAKPILEKSLNQFNSVEFSSPELKTYKTETNIYIAELLKKYYQDTETIDNLTGFIIENAKELFGKILIFEDVIFTVCENVYDLNKFSLLDPDVKRKLFLINYKLLTGPQQVYTFKDTNGKKKIKIYKHLLKTLWYLKNDPKFAQKVKEIYSPLLSPIVWGGLSMKSDQEIIKSLEECYIDRDVAKELIKLVNEDAFIITIFDD